MAETLIAPARLARQTEALRVLSSLPVSDALGAACSYLLHCGYHHRDELRRVMHEPVIREGFRGMSLLELLTRVSQ
jgi:hypothetical protein